MDETTPSTSFWAAPRTLFLALFLLIAGTLMFWSPPIYLVPPLFTYTAVLYLLVVAAGILLLGGTLAARYPQRRAIAGLAVTLLLLGQCCCGMVLLPTEIGLLQGTIIPFGMPHYQSWETLPDGKVVGDICFTSSDDPNEMVQHYEFRRLGPLLWLQSRKQTDGSVRFPCQAFQ